MAEKTHSRISSNENAGVSAAQQLLKPRALSLESDDAENMNEFVEALKSQDLVTKIAAAKAVRRMLSEGDDSISKLVKAGIIAPLVDALERYDCTGLLYEAAWALFNIASGTKEHTNAVVSGGAIPRLVALLPYAGTVAEQAAWALANIAGDGSAARDAVLHYGALPAILPYMRPQTPLTQLRTYVWTYCNMCRSINPMAFELVSPALPYISKLLTIEDQNVLANTCWALFYLIDRSLMRIDAVQAIPGLTSHVIALLTHCSITVLTAALRVLGTILAGTDTQTDRCLDAGCLDGIIALLRCGNDSLMNLATWAAANILSGTHSHIQRALDKNILEPLLHVLIHGDAKCQKRVVCAIANLCLKGTAEQLEPMLPAGFLERYCFLLGDPNVCTVTLVLDGLNILQLVAEKSQQALRLIHSKIREIGVYDQILPLQHHENKQVQYNAKLFLETYIDHIVDIAVLRCHGADF